MSEDMWQPIETAPKDGTRFLAYMPNTEYLRLGGKPFHAVIWWDDEFESVGWDDERDDTSYRAAWTAGRVESWGNEEYAEEQPTHWMPLPAPPGTGESA